MELKERLVFGMEKLFGKNDFFFETLTTTLTCCCHRFCLPLGERAEAEQNVISCQREKWSSTRVQVQVFSLTYILSKVCYISKK